MAAPHATGPAHLFIGVPIYKVEETSVPPTEQRTLSGKIANQPPVLGGFGNIGGRLDNNPEPPPPSYTSNQIRARFPVYLGTAERSPSIVRTPFYLPWYESGLGESGSADELYEGEEHSVIAQLNRWNEPLYSFLAEATATISRARRGVDMPEAIGTSMIFESCTFPLWVQFPNAAKFTELIGGLPAGYRYYNAKLVSPDKADGLGYTPMTRTVAFHCGRYLDMESGITATYDHNMAGLPIVT